MVVVRHPLFLATLLVAIALAVGTGTASAASVRTHKQQCRSSYVAKEVKSFLFRSVLVRMSMRTSWCFDGQRVTRAEAICKVEEIDRMTINIDRCQAQESFESWRGRPNGSVYALSTVNISNCIIVKSIGCVQSMVLIIEARYYANGVAKEES